jgi:adenosylhomocysteinase
MNLGAGQGHPVEIMDMSFSIQALSIEHLSEHYREMEPIVYNVPDEIDDHVASLKLKTMKVKIDTLSLDQRKYLDGWQEGT